MIIQNRDLLLKNSPSKHSGIVLDLFEAGINSVVPEKAVRDNLKLNEDLLVSGDKQYRLEDLERIMVIGGGKASYGMAKAVESVIGSKLDSGLIVEKRGKRKRKLDRVKVLKASHPVPDSAGVKSTSKLLKLAESASEEDLVITLLSGGGSALLTLPLDGIDLDDVKKLTRDLLNSGASIGEINAVRKRLSRIKGGRLARAVHPAKCLTLIISDVVGDDLRYIASGPTVPEDCDPEEAPDILQKYDLTKNHRKIFTLLKSNDPRTLPVDSQEFAEFDVSNQVLASNDTALSSMARRAEEIDISALILSSRLEGESKSVGKVFGQLARSIYHEGHPLCPPALLLSGGETIVTLSDNPGEGGPNQEFTLSGGREIIGLPDSILAAIDSDGEDGSTGIAGGLVCGEAGVGEDQFDSFLKNHDSSRLLKKINGAIVTGQTGTNVNDLRLALVL